MKKKNDFFINLKALAEEAFPKHCNTCGMVYSGPDDFISNTQSIIGKSGLKSSYSDNDTPIVELYRNCVCGSTLMDFFSDRRDNSEKGLRRRDLFERLLLTLERHDISRSAAREELLKLLHGESSEIIDGLGLVIIQEKKFREQ